MKIGLVTVPYITNDNHLAYAVESLNSLITKKHELYTVGVVNRWRESDYYRLQNYYKKIIYNDENILARAWNKGIAHCLEQGCDYVIVPNLDIIAHPDCIDNLVDCAVKNPDGVVWCATQHNIKWNIQSVEPEDTVSHEMERYSFSFYMVNDKLFRLVKRFSEEFKPCYFEDWEMILYIKFMKQKIYRTTNSLFFHYGNRTREEDSEVLQMVNEGFARNQELYNKIEAEIVSKIK